MFVWLFQDYYKYFLNSLNFVQAGLIMNLIIFYAAFVAIRNIRRAEYEFTFTGCSQRNNNSKGSLPDRIM